MATTLNPSDTLLAQTSPRLITVSLANNLLFSGNVTGTVNNVSVTDITNSIANFDSSNDQLATSITAPVAGSITNVPNDDGSVNITFNWSWSGTEAQIDGFIFTSISRSSGAAYTLGTTPAEETSVVVPANKRAHVLYGVATNRYFTFGVRAYRRVSTNVNISGIITSNSSQNVTPYQPSANVNITVNNLNGSGISSYQNSQISLTSPTGGEIRLNNASGTNFNVTGLVMPTNKIFNNNISSYIGDGAISDNYIADLGVGKLNAGLLKVGSYIESQGYVVGGSSGWRINASGNAEFNNVTVRGTVVATAGSIGGITISSGNIRSGQTGFNSGTGFFLGNNGNFSVGNSATNNRLSFDGTTLTIRGALAAGDIGAGTITAAKLRTGNGTGGFVEVGQDVVQAGHYGLSLSHTDFNNIFIRRNDGVVYFRVNWTGSQGLAYDSSSNVFTVNGDIIGTGNIKLENATSARASKGIFSSAWGPGISIPCVSGTPIIICATWLQGGSEYGREIRYSSSGYYGETNVISLDANAVQVGLSQGTGGSGKDTYVTYTAIYAPALLSVNVSFTPTWTGTCWLTMVGYGDPPDGYIAAIASKR